MFGTLHVNSLIKLSEGNSEKQTLLKATLFRLVRIPIIIYNDCNDDNKYIKPEIQEMKPQRGRITKRKTYKTICFPQLCFLEESEKRLS